MRAIKPFLRQVQIVGFQCSIRSAGHGHGIRRHSLISSLVVRFRQFEVSFRGVQISESKVRGEVLGMRARGPGEISFCQLDVALVAREITERRKGRSIVTIQLQNFGKSISRRVFLPQLPLQIAIVQQRAYIGRNECQGFFQIPVRRVEIARCRFNRGSQPQHLSSRRTLNLDPINLRLRRLQLLFRGLVILPHR